MTLFSSSSSTGSVSRSPQARGFPDDFGTNNPKPVWKSPLYWGVFAAVLVAGVGGGALFICPNYDRCNIFGAKVAASYETGIGETFEVPLARNVSITLGPASRLSVFEGDTAVEIDGGAVFSVPPGSDAAFSVRANKAAISVLPIDSAVTTTIFGVRAYTSDGETSVGVVNGRIRLGSVVILNTGNVAEVANGHTTVTFDRSMGPFSGWADGHLTYVESPLRMVASDIGRWFDVDVRIPDAEMRDHAVTASFPIDSVSTVVNAVSQGGGVTVKRVGRVITIERGRIAEPYEEMR